MKNLPKLLSVAALAVALTACACPRVSDYGDTPYDARTAGTGVSVYGQCDVKQAQQQRRVTEVRQAEPVLQQKARK